MTTVLTDSENYTNIASAIRSKAGVQDLFKPSEMASAIMAIPTGGGASLGSKSITANGTYYASADSLDGYSQVTVNVSGGGGSGDLAAFLEDTLSILSDDAITSVRRCAGYLASAITEIHLSAATIIGSSAFFGCVNLTTINLPSCVSVSSGAFQSCASLTSVNLPVCSDIRENAFYSCKALSVIDLPEGRNIGTYAFGYCSNLETVSLPKLVQIAGSAFYDCEKLSVLSFSKLTNIFPQAFTRCFNLVSLDLTGVSSVPTLSNQNAFTSTPIGGYSTSAGQFGSVYVPESLYASFIAATRWSIISDRIVSV